MSDTAAPKAFGPFERMLALRYLRATRKGAGVSLITMIAFGGILLSVATLIVVMSVMQGFRVTLLDQLLGVNGHVFVQPAGTTISSESDLVKRLAEIDGVTLAVPVLKVEAYAVSAGDGQAPVYIQGVRREDLFTIPEVTGPDQLVQGSFEGYGEGEKGGNGIALGSGIAAKLGVGAGESVTLVRGGGKETPFGRTPTTQKTFRVDAIFSTGNYEYDSLLVYMPLEQAQIYAGKKDQISEVEIRVEDPLKVDQVTPAIEAAAGSGVFIFDWKRRFQSLNNALEVERSMIRIILLLLVGIVSLNIISSLVMLVKDKKSDIAVMRTVGATSSAIMRVFLMIGGLIGVTGAVMGIITGVLIATNLSAIEQFLSKILRFRLFNPEIYYLDQIPFVLEWGEVINVFLFALIMAFVAAAYPAWRASRLDPVEALRYE